MRNLYIDWLRGVSIFFVLMTHQVISPDLLFFLPVRLTDVIASNGAYGVTVFFAISGFLITSKSLRTWGAPSAVVPFEFYAQRAARILPLLILFLLFCCLMYALGIEGFVPSTPKLFFGGVVAALTFQFNVYRDTFWTDGMRAMGPLWSLSIEEIFYLAFPLVMITLRNRFLMAVFLVILILQAPAFRAEIGKLYLFRGSVDALSFGCLAGLFAPGPVDGATAKSVANCLRWAGASLIFSVMVHGTIGDFFVFGPSLVAFGTAIFLIGASMDPVTWSFPNLRFNAKSMAILFVPFSILGAVSYELYLFHYAFVTLVPNTTLDSFPLYSALALAVLVPGAIALSVCFTEPFNQSIRTFYFGKPTWKEIGNKLALPSAPTALEAVTTAQNLANIAQPEVSVS